jgi:methyl-accepting chemotaxis protein
MVIIDILLFIAALAMIALLLSNKKKTSNNSFAQQKETVELKEGLKHSRNQATLILKELQGLLTSEDSTEIDHVMDDSEVKLLAKDWWAYYEKEFKKSFERLTLMKKSKLESDMMIARQIAEIYYKVPLLKKFLKITVDKTNDAVNVLIDRFNSVSTESSQLKAEAERSIEEFSNQNQGKSFDQIIKESEDGIGSYRKLIEELVGQNKENMNRFNTVDDKLLQIFQALKSVEDIAQQNKVISINLSIEASQMGAEGKGIKVIISEIQKLNQSTNNFIQQINGIIKSFKEYNQKLVEQLNKESAGMIENIESTLRLSEQNINTLIHSYQNITALFNKMNESNQKVNQDMDAVIESLQFQDITRQQIENVIEFLHGIETGIDREKSENKLIDEVIQKNQKAIDEKIRNEFGKKLKVFDEKLVLETHK